MFIQIFLKLGETVFQLCLSVGYDIQCSRSCNYFILFCYYNVAISELQENMFDKFKRSSYFVKYIIVLSNKCKSCRKILVSTLKLWQRMSKWYFTSVCILHSHSMQLCTTPLRSRLKTLVGERAFCGVWQRITRSPKYHLQNTLAPILKYQYHLHTAPALFNQHFRILYN